MPITVSELVKSAELKIDGIVPWGSLPDEERPGLYVVALSEKAEELICLDKAPISCSAVESWIERVELMRIDKQVPTVGKIVERLSEFWLPDETILYIGQTNRPLWIRIRELYYQVLGKSSRHCGGHWLKALDNLKSMFIYYSVLETGHREAEDCLLAKFNDAARTKKILIRMWL